MSFRALLSLLAAALLFAQAVPSSAQLVPTGVPEAITLEQALRVGLQNNTALLSAEQGVIIAQQRVKEAVFLFLPQATLTGSATKYNFKYPQVLMPESNPHLLSPSDYENFYTARISMLQPLYLGGRNTSTLRMSKASLRQAQTQYDSAKRDASLAIKDSFYKLQYSSAAISARESWLAEMRKLSSGSKAGAWEMLAGAAAAERMESELKAARQQHRLLELDLLRALNKELDGHIAPAGEFRPQPAKADLGKLTVWAMEMRPELRGELYRAEMDAIAVNLAMARRSPTVMMGASYDVDDYSFPLRNNNWEATIYVKLPLSFDFWTQITTKRAEQRQGELSRSATQDKVRLEIRQAYENNVFWQDEVSSRSESYESLHKRYSAVLAAQQPSLAAVVAAREVCLSRLAYLEAVREQLVSRAHLEWALGQDLPQQ